MRFAILAVLVLTFAMFVATPVAAQSAPDACLAPSDAAPVLLGAPVSGAAQTACHYTLALAGDLSGKRLVISLETSEDHDVIVSHGAGPSTCSALGNGRSGAPGVESCVIDWPLFPGDLFIEVRRIAAGDGPFTLTAQLQAVPDAGCSNGFAIVPLSDNVNSPSFTVGLVAGSKCVFSFTPAPGISGITAVSTSAWSAQLALYGRADHAPSTTDNQCAGVGASLGTRICAIGGVISDGSTYYLQALRIGDSASTSAIAIRAASVGCSLGRAVHDLPIGAPVGASLLPGAGSSCAFAAEAGQESLVKAVLTAPGVNFDLRLRRDAVPTTTAADCVSAVSTAGATETCSLRWAGSSVHGLVSRPAGGAAGAGPAPFTLTSSAVEGCPGLGGGLIDLAADSPISGELANEADAACRFRFTPPDEAISHIVVPPVAGSFQLLVQRGSEPSVTASECAAIASTIEATCDLENDGRDVFILLRRSAGSGLFTISAEGFTPCSLGSGDVALPLDVPLVGDLTSDDGGYCRLVVAVPATADGVRIDVAPDSADLDLFVKKGGRPTVASNDCAAAAAGAGGVESCTLVRDAGSYYAMVRRVDGEGSFSVSAQALTSCVQGVAPVALSEGVAAAGTLLAVPGAKCYFAFAPGAPLADPSAPGADLLRIIVDQAGSDVDLFVGKGVVPTPTARDCASIRVGDVQEVCELVVSDESVYFALVQRSAAAPSAVPAAFSIHAAKVSTCALGPGYHPLQSGAELRSSTRAVAGVTKCYFSISSAARDDLFSVSLETLTANTGFSLTVAKDQPIGAGPAECTGTSSYISLFGIVLNTLAQCDRLLEDGDPHDWYISVSRAASAGANDIQFAVKATAMEIPTLLPGVPQMGHVETGGVQYWKVVLPEEASFLAIQTAGDPSNLGCAVGSDLDSTVALACLLLPFPKLVGCAVAAGQGVSCDDTTKTIADHCADQSPDAAACDEAEQARIEACAALNGVEPGTCDPSDTEGSLGGTCGIVNKQTGDNTCDPLAASVKTTEIDLLVRYRDGLPTTAAHDCRSHEPGAIERCLFSAAVQDLHDNTTEPARQQANAAIQQLRDAGAENGTEADAFLTIVKDAVAQLRADIVDPIFAQLRDLLVGSGAPDPGAAPATPGADVPAVPDAAVPDAFAAQPLPGAGKYFIAVRGPLDLASSLFYQGGDYAIVALHDAPQAPSGHDVARQVEDAWARVDQSPQQACVRQTGDATTCGAIGGVGAAVCAPVVEQGMECNVDQSPCGLDAAVCAAGDEAVAGLAELLEPIGPDVPVVPGLAGAIGPIEYEVTPTATGVRARVAIRL